MTAVLAVIADALTGPTLGSGLLLTAVIVAAVVWLAAVTPAPAGPLYVCACGLRYRQRDEEPRRVFHRRQAAHLDVCPATGGAA